MNMFERKPPAIELRPFQAEAIDGVRRELRTHRAVLLQSPTGAGKTVMASFMMSSAVSRGGRPWFVCNRDFLVDQTSKTLARVGLEHGVIAAGRSFNPHRPAQVCSVDTLKNRLGRIPLSAYPSVLIFDEAHHSAAAGWAKIIDHFAGAKVIGLSATPQRLDGKGLDKQYQALVLGPSVAWLIEQGYLSRYRAFAPTMPDLDGVTVRAGDYAKEELGAAMDKPKLVGDIVHHYKQLAHGKRAVYFCVSIEASKHLAEEFRRQGIRARHLDGSDLTDVRKAAARAMAAGELEVITNVDLFGEGYDLAAQAGCDVTIEAVGLCRPTKSVAMYMQQVGRCLRPKDDEAIILDHAGNLMAHGLPDEERTWSLEGIVKGKKKAAPTVPTPRMCHSCFAAFAPNLRACPHCGAAVEVATRVLDHDREGQLEEIDKEELRRQRKQQERDCKTVEDFIAVGRARGYKEPERWAAHQVTLRAQYRGRGPRIDVEAQAAAQRRW